MQKKLDGKISLINNNLLALNMDNRGKLYIIATPIGNLEDITLRALRILKEVDLIACEDTRVTKKLLFHYEISAPLISFHQHSGSQKIDYLLAKISEGENIALVTDAGTPGVSDPGGQLVSQATKMGIEVVAIPGASALTAMISVAGADLQKFIFLGFPPHKKGRQTFFEKVAIAEMPVIYYESPHRVLKNLELLKSLDDKKNIIIGRELTKKFEEIVSGTISEILDYFQKNEGKRKGEFVVIAR